MLVKIRFVIIFMSFTDPLFGSMMDGRLSLSITYIFPSSLFHFFNVAPQALDFVGDATELKHVFNADKKFHFVDGLGQKIIGARINGSFDIAKFIEGCYHQNHYISGAGTVLDLLADFESAQFRHHDVEQD